MRLRLIRVNVVLIDRNEALERIVELLVRSVGSLEIQLSSGYSPSRKSDESEGEGEADGMFPGEFWVLDDLRAGQTERLCQATLAKAARRVCQLEEGRVGSGWTGYLECPPGENPDD